jgi:hypothetical protein
MPGALQLYYTIFQRVMIPLYPCSLQYVSWRLGSEVNAQPIVLIKGDIIGLSRDRPGIFDSVVGSQLSQLRRITYSAS